MTEAKRHLHMHLQAAQAWAVRAADRGWAHSYVREAYARLCWAWLLAGDRGNPTELARDFIEACASAVSELAGGPEVSAHGWAPLTSDERGAAESRVSQRGFLTAASRYSDVGARCERFGLEPRGEQLDLLTSGGLKSCGPAIYCGVCAVREIADEVVGGVA